MNNEYTQAANGLTQGKGDSNTSVLVPIPKNKGGRPKGVSNLHSKHPSSVAVRLKRAGIDWIVDLANALRANDKHRIDMWMKMLPYLIVTMGHRRPKRFNGKATQAAIRALDELEGRAS